MKPISISERMMFNTVRLVASDSSSGTGYFYNFMIDNKIVPVLLQISMLLIIMQMKL